jgi:multidrug efflux pump subunit AcrA (membrane-fusion protein)
MSMPLYELVNVPTSLAKLAKREVQFWLPEEYANLLEKDTSITYTLPNDQTTKHKAIITRISPQVDEMTRTITVQAKIADDMNIPHQTRVDVHLPLTDATFYQVPTSSLVYSWDVVYVVVVDSDENILLKEVSVMADDGEYADIQWSIDSTTALAKNYRQAKKIVEERIKREGIILKENQEETNREDTP